MSLTRHSSFGGCLLFLCFLGCPFIIPPRTEAVSVSPAIRTKNSRLDCFYGYAAVLTVHKEIISTTSNTKSALLRQSAFYYLLLTEVQMKHTLRCMKNEARLRLMKRGFATRKGTGVLCFIEAARLLLHTRSASASYLRSKCFVPPCFSPRFSKR